jgi:hypothetical protein
MKTNLLLLDSYKNIAHLIAFAFSFSNRTQRHLKIVYVFDFEWMKSSYMITASGPAEANLVAVENDVREEYEVAETKVKEVLAEYIKVNKVKIPFEFKVTESNRIDMIREEQKKNPELLLIMSNQQSYSYASGGFVGYPDLIKEVDCPVFIIPDEQKMPEMNHAMYATSYHEADIPAMKHACSVLGETEHFKMTVLHNVRNFNFEEKLKWEGFQTMVKNALPGEKMDFQLKTCKEFTKGVEEFISDKNPDLLVVLKEKKGFFEQVFTSDETKYVITHFHKPVLVYHE